MKKEGIFMDQHIHQILSERFNHHHLIFMATSLNNVPSIRALTPYYENGSFYVITDAKSKKMDEISKNPMVAIAGPWFNASAIANNLGYILKQENQHLYTQLKTYCQSWFELGKVDVYDENTIILQLKITDGYVIENNIRYILKAA